LESAYIVEVRKINIAIDGHSSCGKGTLAKNLARDLNYIFIDSGAMYRAVTYYFLKHDIDFQLAKTDKAILDNIHIEFRFEAALNHFDTYLNGESIEAHIRGMEVSRWVSHVSSIFEVRQFLVKQQKHIGADKGVVMDGRDIGTVVFPDAELKIFMTAQPEVRAQRRYLELEKKGMSVDYDEILMNIMERDQMDSSREISPLRKAEDAITLDNTDMSKLEQSQLALAWAKGVILHV
jgi:CMP/dCMP kinase